MEIQTLFEYETAGIYGHANTGNRSDLDPISKRPKIHLRKKLDNTSRWQTKRPLAIPLPSLAGVLVYIPGGKSPPMDEIMTECKPNLALAGVLVAFLPRAGQISAGGNQNQPSKS